MSGRSAIAPLGAADLARHVDVSRETLDRLAAYLDLLRHWQKAINLVGRSTLDDPWRRHILDSAQLVRYLLEGPISLADLGSGAGLPGLVLAILRALPVHLVEADRRKAQFLREAARQLGLGHVTVHASRIESLALEVDVVTARGLAPLPQLLGLALPLLRPGGRLLFLKGRAVEAELTEARRSWRMNVAMEPSLADPQGRVLIIEKVCPLGR